jgi:hypothetical protein
MAHEPAATVTTPSAAALLPGVAPTGRRVEMALVVIRRAGRSPSPARAEPRRATA